MGKHVDVGEVKLLGDVQRSKVSSEPVSSFLNISRTENIPMMSISDVSGISQDHNQVKF